MRKNPHPRCRTFGEHPIFGLALKEAVLVLHADKPRRARLTRRLSLAQLIDRKIRAPDLSDFSLLHESVERAKGVGNGNRFVGSMQLIQIDVIRTESLEAVLSRAK